MQTNYAPCAITYSIIDDGHTPDTIKGINLNPMPPNLVNGEKTTITVLSTMCSGANESSTIGYVTNKKGNMNLGNEQDEVLRRCQRMIFTFQGAELHQQSLSIDFYSKEQKANQPLLGELSMMVRNSIHAGESPVIVSKEQSVNLFVGPGTSILKQPLQLNSGTNSISAAQLKLIQGSLDLIYDSAFDLYLENLKLNQNPQKDNSTVTWFDGLTTLNTLAPKLLNRFLS